MGATSAGFAGANGRPYIGARRNKRAVGRPKDLSDLDLLDEAERKR
jgi:hypothetical protein